MFTGIIEEVGTVAGLRGGELEIAAKKVLEGTRLGDSIAVNGVCLTVTRFTREGFTADVMPETLRRSSLASAARGVGVNLERAMAADGRFGGHIVSGHIDGTGRIRDYRREGNAIWIEINAEQKLLRYIVEKGSIAIDGVSLTVAAVSGSGFSVSIIPHTAGETTLTSKRRGDTLNLETDIIGKYVEKLCGAKTGGITAEMLR